MSTDPNFYHTAHLKDYDTIEKAVNIVKSLVKPEFAKFVTNEMVLSVWQDPMKRELPLSNLQTFFNNRAKGVKEVESLQSWSGVLVGGRDIKKFDTPIEKVRGQNHIMVLDSGEINSFAGWGHNIGPPGSEVRTPTLQHVTIKVSPRSFKFKDGTVGESWDGKFVAEQHSIPTEELKNFLVQRSVPLSMLDSSMKYQPVLVKGRIGVVMPVERWVEGSDLEEVKDASGNTVYERNPDGTVKLDAHQRPIPRMRYKRETDNVGHPLRQTKGDGSNEVQWIFKVSLYDEDDSDSGNRVSVQFQNTRLGEHYIVMPNASLLLEDAAKKPVGGREDGFSDLTNLWGTKEVVIAGTVISVNEREDSASGKKTVWYGIDGTLMLDATSHADIAADTIIEHVKPVAPVAQVAPVTQAAPVIPVYSPEAAIASDMPKTNMTYPSGMAPIQTPPPAPVIAPPAPTVAQPMQQPVDEIAVLKRAIGTAMDAMGDDIDYQMVMSLNVGMPEKFKHETQKQTVLAFMQMMRNERSPVQAQQAPFTQPMPEIVAHTAPVTEGKIQIPGQPSIASVSVDQILAATSDTPRLGAYEPEGSPETNIKVVPTLPSNVAPIPPGYTQCGRCGKILSTGETISHTCG